MAPSDHRTLSSLSPAAPAYVPKRAAPLIPPPPPPAPGLTTYICMTTPPPPLPGFLPWPYLAPSPPLPWGIPQVQQRTSRARVVPHGSTGAAPVARPRHRLNKSPRSRHPAGLAASCGGAKDAKEGATNQPSPRSVLVATTSPPISPTTSLPASFPYLALHEPHATDGLDAATAEPSPAKGGGFAVLPPKRRRQRMLRRRALPASGAQARRSVPKPRRLFDPRSHRTTLMIRNIPNDFTRKRLMNILDQHCLIENESIAPGGVRSEYDFLYLPIDFRTLANKGYAFVNMTSPDAARRLWRHLHQHRWSFKGSGKTCVVDYADLEGLDQMVMHFSGSTFDCPTDEFLPVRFEPARDGTRPADNALHVVGRLVRR